MRGGLVRQSVTQTAGCDRQVERAGRRNGLHKGIMLQAHHKTRWLVRVKWIRTHFIIIPRNSKYYSKVASLLHNVFILKTVMF